MPGKARYTPILVDYRRWLVLLVVVVSAAMIPLVLRLELDRTLKSAFVTSSPAYGVYKQFLGDFGADEFILVAIKEDGGVGSPGFLESIKKMTAKIEEIPEVDRVLDLSNVKVFQERKGIFGSYPLLVNKDGAQALPDRDGLERIRNGLRFLDYLISPDRKTAGIMIWLQNKWKFSPEMADIQERISHVVADCLPRHAEFGIAGAPVIRQHAQNVAVHTAILYGILCTLITSLASLYIFKNLKVAAIQTVVIGVAVEWCLALMSACSIPLNSTTSLVFGLILMISVSTVIHIVTHYYQASSTEPDKIMAAKTALREIGRPSLMCAATTSVAFATVMISTIPMVQQLGFVMAVGVMIGFVTSIILTPAFLIVLKPVNQRTQVRTRTDSIHRALTWLERFVFTYPKHSAVGGIVFCLLMFAGSPLIRIDTQLLGLFTQTSRVVTDLKFVERNLAPTRSLEVVVEAGDKAFKTPEALKKVAELQKRLEALPDIASVDSPLSLLQYMDSLLSGPGSNPGRLFTDGKVLRQALSVVSFSSDGKALLSRYFDSSYSKVHLTARIKASVTTPMGGIISSVERTGNEAIGGWGKLVVTGEQVVFAAQATEVVDSQVTSVILAFISVTLLLMIQMRSVALGLISLIPNIPPVAVIFGMMGWLGIPLDNVTVFAAAIAIGLAVDDTIHYLTQIRREIRDAAPGQTIEGCIRRSYETTARAMMSTSVVLVLGFLMLCFTPTRPAIYFGFLGAGAVVVALLGDLVFMPAMILSLRFVRDALGKKVPAKVP